MFDIFEKKNSPLKVNKESPPVPEWKPRISQPHEKLADCLRYYSDGKMDFAVFTNGTMALIGNGQPESEAVKQAKIELNDVFHSHPDMRPREMDDGNTLVGFGEHVLCVVLNEITEQFWFDIDSNHQRALTTD